ncbi:MAG: hypothetical protein IJW74_05305, partial [Oscillospiraceae bacterium]|nr:hypothetical protein [Oscillospiraceae bacterium]
VIVNFARNLYWVEFTWFIPVLAGLLCSVYYDNKKIRVLSCALAFLSVFAKSLCGYEYISTILIAMMSFLFADFVSSIVKKDREKSLSYFKTMLVMGALAVMGFAVAIVLHASMRGGGNLMAGIAEIWQQDVMRRTLGGDPADFSEIFAASLTASVGDVVKLYLAPQVEIVAGLSGSWFKLLMLLPVPAFALQLIACKKIDVQQAVLYLLTMAAALSWFVLAKSHSYEHTHTLMWQCGISALYSFAFTYR